MYLLLFFVCLFLLSIQTVADSGYYGIDYPLPCMCNFKTLLPLELSKCCLSRATGSQNGF